MARILLVEDDERIQRVISLRLAPHGYKVDCVANGKLGVDKTLTGKYDLVLIDMHMPVMDGHEATRLLRQKGYNGMIVAVTASAMSADSEKAIKAGCDYFIPKPIGEDFEQRIAEILAAVG